LKSVANLPATAKMPCWLGGGGNPSPENVIAFENGLLDLGAFLETGEPRLLRHTPRWFSENCLPHAYDPAAGCPRWLEFLGQVFPGDDECERTLAQWFGYRLTPDTRQHKFALFIGPPRSGKSTTLRVLTHLLGAHNVATPTLTSLGTRFGLAPLVGKMAVVVPDGHLGRQSDAAAILERLKSVVGGDPQNVDRKNAPELTSAPLLTRFTIAVNELPRLHDSSAALRSRMLVLPFGVSFEGREDFDLGDRLAEEIPGITNWALRGMLDLRRTGRLLQPKAGRDVLDSFARLSSPDLAFLQDCCEFSPGYVVGCDALRAAWVKWCDRNGHEPGGDEKFGANLRAAAPRIERPRRREGGRQHYVYLGVRLAESG
jgi:putative DNA primase/helicase